jgi:hypothetical protein
MFSSSSYFYETGICWNHEHDEVVWVRTGEFHVEPDCYHRVHFWDMKEDELAVSVHESSVTIYTSSHLMYDNQNRLVFKINAPPGFLENVKIWDKLKRITLDYDETMMDSEVPGFELYSCIYPFVSGNGNSKFQFMYGRISFDCEKPNKFALHNVTVSTTRKVNTIKRCIRNWLNKKRLLMVVGLLHQMLDNQDLVHDIVTQYVFSS